MADDECIELSSDDEDVPTNAIGKSKRTAQRRIRTECLNVECVSGENYLDNVPEFVTNYFKVKKWKGLKVCQVCFDEVCSHYSDLKIKFNEKQSIFDAPMSEHKPVLSIDSDEDELSSEDEDQFLDEKTVDMIKVELPGIMVQLIKSENFTFQFEDTLSKLDKQLTKLKDEQEVIRKTFVEYQNEIDRISDSIYKPFRPIYKQLPELDIPFEEVNLAESSRIGENSFIKRKTGTQSTTKQERQQHSYESSNQDVVAVSEEILNPPANLPSQGRRVVKPQLQIGLTVYAMKHQGKPWKTARITQKRSENIVGVGLTKEYQLQSLESGSKNSFFWRPAKYLAFETSTKHFRYPVRFRVIALYSDEGIRLDNNAFLGNATQRAHFYPGIVAEPPNVMNRFRYLIFFDNEFVQYVPHEHIRLIYETSITPWEEVPVRSQAFMKKYLSEYPERPMVRLQVGNIIQVKFNDLWLEAKVLEVDCSLAKVSFRSKDRIEWIYRGSPRLRPLYSEFEAAKRCMQSGNRVRVFPRLNASTGQRSRNQNMFVEYTHNIDGDESADDVVETVSTGSRAVARKSTSFSRQSKTGKPEPFRPDPVPGQTLSVMINETVKPQKFVAHQCTYWCTQWTGYDYSKVRKLGPLAIPLNFGFRRIIGYFNGGKKTVLYKTPCGRNVRNMEEVHLYLRITKSTMTVDFFDFDYWVDCTSIFVINEANVNIADVTEGKERVAIGCVNYINHDRPKCAYLESRIPRESVNLNLDPAFLTGCDCEDDCQDREKCSCWQMTIEAQKTIPNNVMDPNVGYHYRRLPEKVITGVYECNQLCKCSKISCLNRVVQNPLSQQLQLFKTRMKGWGLRCLNDIPQGSFICVYAGHLLPDDLANEEGANYGDEYLADLDYIEHVEHRKYGYESDVPADDDDSSSEEDNEQRSENISRDRNMKNEKEMRTRSESSSSLSDDDSIQSYTVSQSSDIDNIRSRLRERKSKHSSVDDSDSETESKKSKKEYTSIRSYYGKGEDKVFIMDARSSGNIGRYLNHSCSPNVFVQNVFVDTHDLRFPWVAFFAQTFIRAGTELTWDYAYQIGSVDGTVKYCYCGSEQCRKRLL